MDMAHLKIILDINCHRPGHRHARQYHAFRERILRMWEVGKAINDDAMFEIELRDLAIAEKDARIADIEEHNTRLEAELKKLRDWIEKPIIEGGGRLT